MTITMQMIPYSVHRHPQMTWMGEKFFVFFLQFKIKLIFSFFGALPQRQIISEQFSSLSLTGKDSARNLGDVMDSVRTPNSTLCHFKTSPI